MVLASCEHHLDQHVIVLKGDNTRTLPPRYPYHLVLRADGSVERVPLSRIHRFVRREDLPILETLYPGEPGYDRVEE